MKRIKFPKSQTIFKVLAFILIIIFSWVIVIPIKPIMPSLSKKFPLCNLRDLGSWDINNESFEYLKSIINKKEQPFIELSFKNPVGDIALACKTHIPLDKLYQANTLNLEIKANQKMEVKMHLRNIDGDIIFNYITYNPEAESSPANLITQLDQKTEPRINWLKKDFTEVVITVKSLKSKIDPVIKIYSVYLN